MRTNQKEQTELRKRQTDQIKWSVPYYDITITKDSKISISKGNSKLGKNVWIFNLLPGEKLLSTKELGILTDVTGTCAGCCNGCEKDCYAINDTLRHHNACIQALVKNTLMVRENMQNVFKQLSDNIDKHKINILRYHSSGEIETYDYLLEMVKLANEKPKTKFYFYTKRIEFVIKYLKQNKCFPKNLTCNISAWHNLSELENKLGEYSKQVNYFIYDDGDDKEITHNMIHCKAVDKKPGAKKGHKTGQTCSECKMCYAPNNGHKTCVYNH